MFELHYIEEKFGQLYYSW